MRRRGGAHPGPLALLGPVLALSLVLAGCAGRGPRGDDAGQQALAGAEQRPVPAEAAEGELSPAELGRYLDAQYGALRQALAPAARSGLVTASRGSDGTVRVRLDADRAFDRDSAQFRPEALQPLAALAAILGRDRASVLQVIARDPRDLGLGERRAAAAAAVLVADGAIAGRVRDEARADRGDGGGAARLDFIFVPVVAGQEARAWMPVAVD